MWIALKAQKVQRDGKLVDVKPGDPVPEAETWPNRPVWIRTGYIRWVERGETKAKEKAPTVVKTRPKPKPKVKAIPASVKATEKVEEIPKVKPKKTKKDDK